jgi:hypothetical protein
MFLKRLLRDMYHVHPSRAVHVRHTDDNMSTRSAFVGATATHGWPEYLKVAGEEIAAAPSRRWKVVDGRAKLKARF